MFDSYCGDNVTIPTKGKVIVMSFEEFVIPTANLIYLFPLLTTSMIKSLVMLMVVIFSLMSGCAYQPQEFSDGKNFSSEKVKDDFRALQETNLSNNDNVKNKQELNHIPDSEDSSLNKEFSLLEREINILVNEGYVIGPDHYQRLKDRIQGLEKNNFDDEKVETLLKKLEILGGKNERNHDNAMNQRPSFRKDPELPSESERGQLPDCEGKFFSNLPVDLSKIYEITPLGNLAPRGIHFLRSMFTFM